MIKNILKTVGVVSIVSFSTTSLISCDSDDILSSSGSGSSSSDIAPASIISKTIRTKVTSNPDGVHTAAAYRFVSPSVIYGEGQQTTLDTESYSWSKQGNKGIIKLVYPNGGVERFNLTFDSATSGTYQYIGEVPGQTYTGGGTFTLN